MPHDSHTGQVKTASGINVILGLWFLISPWVYGYTAMHAGSVWNNIIVGIIIAILAAIRFFSPYSATWLSWLNALLGVWVVISPWIYGYSANGGRTWNSVILGIIVIVLSIWSASATNSDEHVVQA